MQLFRGIIKIGQLSFDVRDEVKALVPTLNTRYWFKENVHGVHVLISKVTFTGVTMLVMSEGVEVTTSVISFWCKEYISDLFKLIERSGAEAYTKDLQMDEVTLSTFCKRFSEERYEEMYDDSDAIMKLMHIDDKKYVFDEELLEPLKIGKQIKRHYISKEELSRIRNGRISSGIIAYQPVHYIVAENSKSIIEQIDSELLYELRKSGRIVSRRCLRITPKDIEKIWASHFKIQNLNNLDGGIVFADIDNEDDAHTIIRAVYSEDNLYRGKYCVVFHVREDSKGVIDEIKKVCISWPFVTISGNRLSRQGAVASFYEMAKSDGILVPKKECNKIIKGNRSYSYDEISTLYRKWVMTEYTVNTYHPQYREIIDKYREEQCEQIDALKELNGLIGLEEVKLLCKRIIDFYELQKIRNDVNPGVNGIGMNMVFTGNPGTAKTTVARIIAKIFKQRGILSKGDLIEVGRGDLVAKYVGWTAKTVKDYFVKATGSVLFIDEAYSLVDGDKKTFGTEAINTIVQEMENRRNEVMVIFAGYKKEMSEFLSTNSGLESRISFYVDFPDYSGEELYGILELFAKNENYELGDDVYDAFMSNIERVSTERGNGRMVRNEFEMARLRQAERILQLPKKKQKEELFKLVGQDFGGVIK